MNILITNDVTVDTVVKTMALLTLMKGQRNVKIVGTITWIWLESSTLQSKNKTIHCVRILNIKGQGQMTFPINVTM